MKNNSLNREQVEQFYRDGVLVVRDFYDPIDVCEVQRGIYNIIGRVLARHDLQMKIGHFQQNALMIFYFFDSARQKPWNCSL